MVALKFLLGDKVHCRVVIREIVRHRLDLALNALLVRAFLGHDEALAGVLFAGGQLGGFAIAHTLQRALHGDRILARVLHALNAADRVGMALAHALAPEGIARALREDCVGIETVEREETRIPAAGDQGGATAGFRGGVHGGKMLRDSGVRVEAVHHVKQGGAAGRLLGEIRRAAAAEDQHVQLILPLREIVRRMHAHTGRKHGDGGRITAGKHSVQLHVRILPDGALHAASQVAISQNTNSNCHILFFLPFTKRHFAAFYCCVSPVSSSRTIVYCFSLLGVSELPGL